MPSFHHPEYLRRRPMHMCILPYIVPALLTSELLLQPEKENVR
ncbi:MAG: hypothetical protein PHS41_11025 [Victivallaceae bacterium]|nr:hypothetical protein [Victivallaceae bacterium]